MPLDPDVGQPPCCPASACTPRVVHLGSSVLVGESLGCTLGLVLGRSVLVSQAPECTQPPRVVKQGTRYDAHLCPYRVPNRAAELPYAVAAVLSAHWSRRRWLLDMGVGNAAGWPYGSRHKTSPRTGYHPLSKTGWASQPISLLKQQTQLHQRTNTAQRKRKRIHALTT